MSSTPSIHSKKIANRHQRHTNLLQRFTQPYAREMVRFVDISLIINNITNANAYIHSICFLSRHFTPRLTSHSVLHNRSFTHRACLLPNPRPSRRPALRSPHTYRTRLPRLASFSVRSYIHFVTSGPLSILASLHTLSRAYARY